MVAKEGYPIETHTVITEDCYILEMHRIPYGKNSRHVQGEKPRPAVYLQHGLLCSSADWVMGAPDKSLGKNLHKMTNTDFSSNCSCLSINKSSLPFHKTPTVMS